MDIVVEDAVIKPQPVKLCTTSNPSGCCMCSWMSPSAPVFRMNRWGTIYMSYVTEDTVLWWIQEER